METSTPKMMTPELERMAREIRAMGPAELAFIIGRIASHIFWNDARTIQPKDVPYLRDASKDLVHAIDCVHEIDHTEFPMSWTKIDTSHD